MKNAILKIKGMHCNGCASIIQSLLSRRQGTKAVSVSYADGLARIQFDPRTVSEQALVTLIENAGYEVLTGPAEDPAADC